MLDGIVGAARDDGSPISTVEIRHWRGAMADPRPDAGPVGHRQAPISVIADAADPALVESLRAHATGGSFLNFLSNTTATATAYAPADYRRLRGVKSSYDPDNVFRTGHTIPPLPSGGQGRS